MLTFEKTERLPATCGVGDASGTVENDVAYALSDALGPDDWRDGGGIAGETLRLCDGMEDESESGAKRRMTAS